MKQIFKPTLPTKDIIVRQDDGSSKFITENAGVYYPLIRINDTTISFADIIKLSLYSGVASFLPTLTVTLDDSSFELRESNLQGKKTILTVFIGNPNDEVYEPIKSDYLITEITSSVGQANVTIKAVLYVPMLYKTETVSVFDTGLNTLKQIAEECKLGFVSNISESRDKMNWITVDNRLSLIQDICKHMFIDNTASVSVFVDHYGNLVVADIVRSLNSDTDLNRYTNVHDGSRLSAPVKLSISNNKVRDDIEPVLITYYTPVTKYGANSLTRYTQLNYHDFDEQSKPVILDNNVEQDRTVNNVLYDINVNTHKLYEIAEQITEYNKSKLQGTNIRAELEWFIPAITMLASVPCEIYNTVKNDKTDTQQNTVGFDNINDESGKASMLVKNTSLSGRLIVTSISLSFTKSAKKISETVTGFIKTL